MRPIHTHTCDLEVGAAPIFRDQLLATSSTGEKTGEDQFNVEGRVGVITDHQLETTRRSKNIPVSTV